MSISYEKTKTKVATLSHAEIADRLNNFSFLQLNGENKEALAAVAANFKEKVEQVVFDLGTAVMLCQNDEEKTQLNASLDLIQEVMKQLDPVSPISLNASYLAFKAITLKRRGVFLSYGSPF